MKYTVVDNIEWTYPDYGFDRYETAADAMRAHTGRNTTVGFQVLMEKNDETLPAIALEGVTGTVYELYPIFVEGHGNHGLTRENAGPHFPERWAPFWIYDCIRTLGSTMHPRDGVAGLYVAIDIPADAPAGKLTGTLRVGDTAIAIDIDVHDVTLPSETSLKFHSGYNRRAVAEYHGLEQGTEAFDEMDTAYLKTLRHAHLNTLYCPWGKAEKKEDGTWDIDFTPLKDFIAKTWALGYRYYNLGGVGFRRSWSESTILVKGSIPAMSWEAYEYLAAYLPKLQAMLEENGWLDNCYLGVSDEPNDANATEFRALAGMIRRLAPRIKLQDALSYGPVFGALDCWIPLNKDYQEHQKEFEALRANGDEIWHYVCCGPREPGYINRFMDIPVLATRYLFWGNYKYNLTGYLHWASNSYQPGQDPFLSNEPTHINADSVSKLEPGDTHIVYPGEDGPWMSIRLEAQRESAEDYELLTMLAGKDKALADEICEVCFHSFKDVEYNFDLFKANRIRLLEALEK